MRNHRFCFIGIVFLALACLLPSGCAGPVQELPGAENTGIVRVTVGTGARTLMPALPSINSYHFNFVSLESPPRETVDAYTTPADPSLEQRLIAGSWTLAVRALDSGDNEIARGSTTLLVLEGMTSSVTVQLVTVPGEEPGTLRYTLQFPDTVTRAFLTLVSMDGGTDSTPVDLLTDYIVSDGIITKTGVLETAAGNYLLSVDLYGSAGNAGKTEAVQIYSNRETAMGAGYAFTAGDFAPTTTYSTESGQSLYAMLTAIGGSSGTDFTILLDHDEPAFAPFTLTTASFNGKKIRIRGEGHTVALSGTGSLFTLETGAALVLQNVELHGKSDNTKAVISVSGGDLLMNSGTVVTGNSSSSSYGGGVFVDSGTFTMSGGIISDNSSSYGGGIAVANGTFTMNGGTISENSVSNYGGGVFVYATMSGEVLVRGTFTMSGGTISDNSSSSSGGGGVFVSGIFTMNGGTISDNSSSSGGGVDVYSGTFTMSGGTISDNSAPVGGGVDVRDSGAFIMNDGIISGNSSDFGGGVDVYSGTFTMSGGTISGNSSFIGGGVDVRDSGAFIMNDGIISGNSSSSSSGGGGVDVDSGTFTMSEGTISDNSAFESGGGVRVYSGAFTMSGGTISENSAAAGGGVCLMNDSAFTMSGGIISENLSSSSTVSYGGGGVAVYYSSTFAMSGGTISGNSAAAGGGVYVYNSTFTKTSGTVYGDSPASTTTPQTSGSNANTATNAFNAGKNGHAVFYADYYRNETLADDASGNISTTDTLPVESGDTLNNWTRR